MSYPDYLATAATWVAELYRVLQPNGRLALNVLVDIARGQREALTREWLLAFERPLPLSNDHCQGGRQHLQEHCASFDRLAVGGQPDLYRRGAEHPD